MPENGHAGARQRKPETESDREHRRGCVKFSECIALPPSHYPVIFASWSALYRLFLLEI